MSGEEAESRARATVLEGIDRLESTLDGRDYLFGDAFSVADLTAASLLYPMVLPPEGPRLPGAPDSAQPFRDELRVTALLELGRANLRAPPRPGSRAGARVAILPSA